MKIVMIGQKGIPCQEGGIERHVDELSQALVKKGHEVLAYVRPYYAEKKLANTNGVHLKRLLSIHTKHLDALSHTFFATIHALIIGADIYHYHGVGPSLLSFLPRIFRPKSKVIVTFHCKDQEHKKWGKFAQWVLTAGEWTSIHFPHGTIFVSQTLMKDARIPSEHCFSFIPNGAYVNPISPAKNIDHFGLAADSYFLVVSRLVPHKNIHHVLQAFQKVQTEKKLVIVGSGAFTDSYVQELKSLAKKDSRVMMIGQQPIQVITELFAGAKALIHPSQSEGMPITVLEAMGNGCLIIASNIENHVETLGDAGIYFSAGDISDCAKAIETVLSNPDLTSLKMKGRERVRKYFQWDSIAVKTIDFYKSVLS